MSLASLDQTTQLLKTSCVKLLGLVGFSWCQTTEQLLMLLEILHRLTYVLSEMVRDTSHKRICLPFPILVLLPKQRHPQTTMEVNVKSSINLSCSIGNEMLCDRNTEVCELKKNKIFNKINSNFIDLIFQIYLAKYSIIYQLCLLITIISTTDLLILFFFYFFLLQIFVLKPRFGTKMTESDLFTIRQTAISLSSAISMITIL